MVQYRRIISLIVVCLASSALLLPTALPISAVQSTRAATDYYYRWTAWDAPTCSTASGGSILTGPRHLEYNLPAGAAFRATYDANGSQTTTALFALPAGTGTSLFATFFYGGLGSYPFYFAYILETFVDGVPVYRSTARIDCTADGPGTFTLTNAPIAPEHGGSGQVPDNAGQGGDHANAHACNDNPGKANAHRPDNVPPCR
jgi:hypothetical protein